MPPCWKFAPKFALDVGRSAPYVDRICASAERRVFSARRYAGLFALASWMASSSVNVLRGVDERGWAPAMRGAAASRTKNRKARMVGASLYGWVQRVVRR